MITLFTIFVLATPMAGLVLTYFVLFRDGAKNTGRWGYRPEKRAIGASPYRAGESTEHLPKGAPFGVRFVCWFCAMGGVITTGVLAPGGLIFTPLEHVGGFASFLVLFVSGSGFPAGVMLIRVARQVVRNEAVEASSFQYLYAHHAAVAGTMILVDVVSARSFDVAPFSVITCLVLVMAVMMLHMGAKVLPKGEESSVFR